MQPSDEVRDAMSSLISTFGTSEMAAAFIDAMASEPGTLLIGTDPAEWWDSRDSMTRAFRAQGEELRSAVATISHCEGWEEGDIGWAAARVEVAFQGVPTAKLRITGTFVQRTAGWKIVQGHVSVGAANKDVVGKELTI